MWRKILKSFEFFFELNKPESTDEGFASEIVFRSQLYVKSKPSQLAILPFVRDTLKREEIFLPHLVLDLTHVFYSKCFYSAFKIRHLSMWFSFRFSMFLLCVYWLLWWETTYGIWEKRNVRIRWYLHCISRIYSNNQWRRKSYNVNCWHVATERSNPNQGQARILRGDGGRHIYWGCDARTWHCRRRPGSPTCLVVFSTAWERII